MGTAPPAKHHNPCVCLLLNIAVLWLMAQLPTHWRVHACKHGIRDRPVAAAGPHRLHLPATLPPGQANARCRTLGH